MIEVWDGTSGLAPVSVVADMVVEGTIERQSRLQRSK